MLFEYRTYQILPGKTEVFVAGLEQIPLPTFQKHGARLIGCWRPAVAETDNLLIYILGYRSLAHREEVWEAFLQDEAMVTYRDEVRHDPRVAGATSKIMLPTDFSPPEPVLPAISSTRVYEHHTYIALPGKNSRFRRGFQEVDLPLLAKHGATLVAAWEPLIGGEANEFLSILAFDDLRHRQQVWHHVCGEEEWQRYCWESQAHPYVAREIVRVMRPTPASPLL